MPKTAPFNNYYKLYEEWFERNKFVYLSELEAVRYFIPKNKFGIEIGSGTGRFSIPYGIKIGIEPSVKMQKISLAKGMKVIGGVAEALPLKNGIFDFALMVTTICFVDEVEKSFKEVHRILKENGVFIVGLVDKESALGLKYLAMKTKSKFYGEATFYSTKEVLYILEKTGFHCEKVIQTVFGNSLKEIKSIQKWEEGYGRGSFVVIRARRKRIDSGG
ncbi:class I SAM-dependent methyltransferase [Candidatus Calescamantes bacterium]|nr:class I SAM-dependent methyltransferase [Candidatus Calescamantes bacterium]